MSRGLPINRWPVVEKLACSPSTMPRPWLLLLAATRDHRSQLDEQARITEPGRGGQAMLQG